MHSTIYEWCQKVVPDRPVRVLDIGGRDVNGTTRALFAEGSTTVSVDLREGPAVDVVGDICDVELDGLFDVAISTSVLEHAENWREMIAAAFKWLKPGGMFIMTCAGPGWAPHSAEDGGALREGEYYGNLSAAEVSEQMADVGFVNADCHESAPGTDWNDCCAVGWKP
jgi:predicted methyltransferase